MTLNAKIVIWNFLVILGCDTSHKLAPSYYRYAIQVENLVFVY